MEPLTTLFYLLLASFPAFFVFNAIDRNNVGFIDKSNKKDYTNPWPWTLASYVPGLNVLVYAVVGIKYRSFGLVVFAALVVLLNLYSLGTP